LVPLLEPLVLVQALEPVALALVAQVQEVVQMEWVQVLEQVVMALLQVALVPLLVVSVVLVLLLLERKE
jgi:L-cystine uptake protein TcyP (sodium:dicarboxylate symporter family)